MLLARISRIPRRQIASIRNTTKHVPFRRSIVMLDWQQVHAAVRPLRLIFWGALIWIIDLTFTTTTNGTGFRFDLLDDTLATVMISVAVFRLARAPVPRPYPAVMAFIKVVAILAVCDTALRHLSL